LPHKGEASGGIAGDLASAQGKPRLSDNLDIEGAHKPRESGVRDVEKTAAQIDGRARAYFQSTDTRAFNSSSQFRTVLILGQGSLVRGSHKLGNRGSLEVPFSKY
jgi:hypothetical protein